MLVAVTNQGMPEQQRLFDLASASPVLLRLTATLDYIEELIRLEWFREESHQPEATLRIRCTGLQKLTWELVHGTTSEQDDSSLHRSAIRARLARLSKRFVVAEKGFAAQSRVNDRQKRSIVERLQSPADNDKWVWLEDKIVAMARDLRIQFSPLGRMFQQIERQNPSGYSAMEDVARQEQKKQAKLAAELARRREMQQRLRDEQRKRQAARQTAGREHTSRTRKQTSHETSPAQTSPPRSRLPVPPVPLAVELPAIEFQQVFLSLPDLKGYFLRERAARWWISNQSDDLLCLPYCRIQRLEYQIRSALRVLGPLRGRALLSDEVGLGKTIEAGLVLKEYLTRGMAKRALILTVPSLVDQWEEELADKFNLASATTNHPSFRADPAAFWRDHNLIVASLHTVKQPAHVAVAQTVNWDLLVVDEAHYLRNRESQAWQAVNALPRQFLLLLTATPVQNSLEELYNLVTLLKPGQLPSPKEFRARFIDRNKPHQPRQPEELRRLLGQVMIRNTRANAGIQLPPRRAETVLFEPDVTEREFWQSWEKEFREQLTQLNPSQASLWGRLLLQAAGSSPNAWRGALEKFPARAVANGWSGRAPLEASWKTKCELLLPLTQGEGGVVIFSQFLKTQAALAEHLRRTKVPTFVINGQTPPVERQPMSDAFRQQGGALLLTHSGTEGRNLQFCHRLVNFDLPWNPMEIEQRIGRLHRIGQQHPVRIFNLVQAGTLQEHLLQILQEKLNLFELVVGETGLILGDRFSSDEFAEEVFRRWRESEGRVAEALQNLGDELATAHADYQQVKQLDETLFAKDYEL
ncbi:MAG: SNF2-related protein [Verrucomicrobiota bacterium]